MDSFAVTLQFKNCVQTHDLLALCIFHTQIKKNFCESRMIRKNFAQANATFIGCSGIKIIYIVNMLNISLQRNSVAMDLEHHVLPSNSA